MCKLETTVKRNERFQAPSAELPLEHLTALKTMEIKPACSGISKIQTIHAQDGCQGTQEVRRGVNAFLTNGKNGNSEAMRQASKSSQRPNVPFSNKYEEKILKSLKPECIAVVDSLLDRIKQLSILQKALLYLRLPTSKEDPDVLDPLRRPLNLLGNRQEVSQALSYIRTHFSPDPDISLPKKEIYSEYNLYCQRRKIRPLSTADFGKAMKQVYPVVRPRRLGERGNSRYCYSGLSNSGDLSRPKTAVSSQVKMSEKICSWASKMLNVNIANLSELGKMIPNENQSNNSQEKPFVRTSFNLLDGCSEHKRKPEVGMIDTGDSRPAKQRKKSHSQKGGLKHLNYNLPSAQTKTPCAESKSNVSNFCDINYQKPKEIGSSKVEPSLLGFSDLNPEKSTNVKLQAGTKSSPQKRQRKSKKNDNNKKLGTKQYNTVLLLECQTIPIRDNFEIQSIEEEGSEISRLSSKEILKEVPLKSPLLSKELPISTNICDSIVHNSDIGVDSNEAQDCDQSTSYKEIGYLASNCIGHYLQDEGNSQEPEEELLKYFKDPTKAESKEYDPNKNMSQLRLLLDPNSSGDASSGLINKPSERDTGFSEEEPSKAKVVELNNFFVLSPQQDLPQTVQKTTVILNNSSKRRVSFENMPVSFSQSPNNPRKSFSFTPISPRPPTISKSTVSVSPFVFPRETVVRGKQSSLNNSGHQNPVPSPAPTQMSPLKSMSRSTSQSSTPSPITNARTQFSKGRSTPQDTSQDQTDSVKCSPIISPSSSSGVFLSPASPMSSCNSPVFTFRKCMSPVKQSDEIKSSFKSNTSLLQSLLMTEKTPGNKSIQTNRSDILSQNDVKTEKREPLAVDVFRGQEENALTSGTHPFRSQSVPVGKNSLVISPLSNTLTFPIPSFKNKESETFLDVKPNDLEIWDTVLNETQIENSSDHGTMDSESHAENEVSMESVFSNLYEFFNDKGLSSHSTNGSLQLSQVSRSHPNTPLLYNDCSNSSRDPVVSAFPVPPGSKSYPSTPTVSNNNFSYSSSTANSSAKRNINPLLDSIPGSSFDDMELQLNNLQELSGCDDAFNELAREVEINNDFTSE